MTGLPDLLTVEEAARVLRIGRTKAYAMTVEWRRTHGKTGLPVVDFGNALRVPRCHSGGSGQRVCDRCAGGFHRDSTRYRTRSHA